MMPAGPSRSVEEHLEHILSGAPALSPRKLSLAECLGTVTARDVLSWVDVPPFDNSSMDGYAVLAGDLAGASPATPVVLDVIADLAAGTDANPTIGHGTAARIMTGAPIPDGADAIVPVEGTDGGIDRVVITEVHAHGAFIRRTASDVRAGEPVIPAGTRLTGRHLAAAAATGNATLLVHPRPRVGVVSTGSELVEPGAPLTRGRIHDSNGVLLTAAISEAGGVPSRTVRVDDDENALRRALDEVAAESDLVVLSGGASVGAYDVVKGLLSREGAVQFFSVRMQPGKPQGFGHWTDGTPVFALPGNPVSALVSFEVFVRPAIEAPLGREARRPHRFGVVTEGWRTPPGRRQYMPVVVERNGPQGTEPGIAPATSDGSASHLVVGLTRADALAIVAETVTDVVAGDRLPLLALPGSFLAGGV